MGQFFLGSRSLCADIPKDRLTCRPGDCIGHKSVPHEADRTIKGDSLKKGGRLSFRRVLCLSGFAGTGTRKGCVIIMENRTNRRLRLLFAATLFFYLVLAICGSMPSWMMLGFPIIPAFCLQLLLCRVLRRKWLAVLPLVVIGGALLVFVWGLTRSVGWDGFFWAGLLLFTLGPATGCLAAWIGYAVHTRDRRIRRPSPPHGKDERTDTPEISGM